MLRLHYAPDNASLVIRLALDEIGVPFETMLVDRSRAAQNSPAYRKLNPRGLIPVLETPHGPMFETAAILVWLADETGKLAPGPSDPGRPLFLSWMVAVSNGLQTDLSHLTHPERYGGNALAGAAHTRMRRMLDLLEALAGDGHSWFAGASPSVFDLYVAVVLRWLALYPKGETSWFRLTDWPRLSALAARVEARPSVVRAQEVEGLGPTPFSEPTYPNPPEGSAT